MKPAREGGQKNEQEKDGPTAQWKHRALPGIEEEGQGDRSVELNCMRRYAR